MVVAEGMVPTAARWWYIPAAGMVWYGTGTTSAPISWWYDTVVVAKLVISSTVVIIITLFRVQYYDHQIIVQ